LGALGHAFAFPGLFAGAALGFLGLFAFAGTALGFFGLFAGCAAAALRFLGLEVFARGAAARVAFAFAAGLFVALFAGGGAGHALAFVFGAGFALGLLLSGPRALHLGTLHELVETAQGLLHGGEVVLHERFGDFVETAGGGAEFFGQFGFLAERAIPKVILGEVAGFLEFLEEAFLGGLAEPVAEIAGHELLRFAGAF